MKKVLHLVGNYLPFLVIGLVFLWSIVAMATYRAREAPDDAIVLRIGHWQLEASVREALEIMAEDYRKINPRVHIVQDAIPEMVYAQWATTQLMGGTAPDLIEVGAMLPYHLWLQYYNRYCVHISEHVASPNPYNEGTVLEGIPLRNTFKDGMRNAYIDEMQEYVSVPLSQFGVRIFYNKDLLKEITGLDAPPEEYRAFLEVCRQIEQTRDRQGLPYTPIASSRYHFTVMWEPMMLDPVTYPVLHDADFNRDGTVGTDELYVAFKSGRVSFRHPAVYARFKMLREVADHFQTGWTGLTRDEAVFLFAQERAVFMATGTWDAGSLQEQARGVFEVGVMDFPLPAEDDPEYGDVIEGPLYERPQGGFPFAITRTSDHPEVALDFLMFMASREQNEKLNRIIGWIPAVKETEMAPLLKDFDPHLEGVYGCFNLFLGGETWVRWLQLYSLYQIDQISFDDMVAEFEPFYIKQGRKDLEEQQKDWRRAMLQNEQFLAGIRAQALVADGEGRDALWVKYRTLTGSRQVWPEINRARTLLLLDEADDATRSIAPYAYGENVAQAVRDRLAAESSGGRNP